jgi:DNA-directed RNA polymerase II subunit RPB7
LEPKEYGPNLKEKVREKLVETLENTCSERYGFILKVYEVDIERLEGRIESTGMQPNRGGTATFTVTYNAIVFKPFRNEVLEGQVKSVAQQGVFCQCGPMQVFISKANLADDENKFEWKGDQTPACWMSNDEKQTKIQEKTKMRIRLMGVRLSNDVSKSSAVGLITDDHLGPILNAD